MISCIYSWYDTGWYFTKNYQILFSFLEFDSMIDSRRSFISVNFLGNGGFMPAISRVL